MSTPTCCDDLKNLPGFPGCCSLCHEDADAGYCELCGEHYDDPKEPRRMTGLFCCTVSTWAHQTNGEPA